MDLCEITNNRNRHPWELTRVEILIKILQKWLLPETKIRVLDVGCGDAFVSDKLHTSICLESYDGVDINLSDSQIRQLSKIEKKIILHNNFDGLSHEYFNLILFLDVIEHVENDYAFLDDIVNKYAAPNALILLTVPAFNFLFGSHDLFLGHFRRYRLKQLIALIHNLGYECLTSGYMFLSLVPIRLASLCYEKLAPQKHYKKKGVGHWKHGRMITKIIELFLYVDNRFSLVLNKIGIKLPGLTSWALCRKPPS
jgi:hypothetical protein